MLDNNFDLPTTGRSECERDSHFQSYAFGREGNQGKHEILEELSSLKDDVADLHKTVTALRELLASQPTAKDSYSTKEVAEILGKKPYTVREWCRLQRVNAFKAAFGRGCEEEWRISHEELTRIQNEGLLPIQRNYRNFLS